MVDESSASGAPGATTGKVSLPEHTRSPWWELGRRLLLALAILVGTVLLVYFDRDGYRDNNDPTQHAVDIVDSIYYTTVTLSTTGYGDIAPVTRRRPGWSTRSSITPLRIAFLVLLIGTTLEVLASQGREMFRVARWRKTMGKHVVVVGYGTKGRSAVETLVSNGQDRESIVVVDPSRTALADAHADGLAVVTGDATRRVGAAPGRGRAGHPGHHHHRPRRLQRARHPDRAPAQPGRLDRRRRPASRRTSPLMRQSGANSVITSSDAVGRLLGLSSLSPTLGSVMEDLLTYGEGLEVAERDLLVTEVGQAAAVAARPGDRRGARREGLPLLRPRRRPAGPRRPADRRHGPPRSCRGRPARAPTARSSRPTRRSPPQPGIGAVPGGLVRG